MTNVVTTEFKPAYTVSNEDLRWITKQTPNAERVLTVAGSGDQALFYHLAGAKLVHTFDHTRNAKLIQDIKAVAVKKLSRAEYFDLLTQLHKCRKIEIIPELDKIIPYLPSETVQYIQNSKDIVYAPFSAGSSPNTFAELQPTDTEYAKLSATIEQPFKFILGDLNELHKKIHTQYDVINLSNIFDNNYGIPFMEQLEIMGSLIPFMTIGGYIVVHDQFNSNRYDELKIKRRDTGAQLNFIKNIRQNPNMANTESILLFQRVR